MLLTRVVFVLEEGRECVNKLHFTVKYISESTSSVKKFDELKCAHLYLGSMHSNLECRRNGWHI